MDLSQTRQEALFPSPLRGGARGGGGTNVNPIVMAGLDPAIQRPPQSPPPLDGRLKGGRDGSKGARKGRAGNAFRFHGSDYSGERTEQENDVLTIP
jgi:hypothetical protein